MTQFLLWSRVVRGVQWTFALAVVLILLDLANIAWQGRAARQLYAALIEDCQDLNSRLAVPQSVKARLSCAILLHVRPIWSKEWMSRVTVVGKYHGASPTSSPISACDTSRWELVILREEYWGSLWDQPELFFVRLDARQMPRDSFRTLQGHPTLQSLMLVNTTFRDEDCADLASLPNLKHLALSSPYLTDRCLEHLKDLPLEELWLKSPRLTGEALKVMARMPGPDGHGLRYLGLLEAAVTDEDVSCLHEHRLLGLELAHTQITDASIAELSRLPNLSWLKIGCNDQLDHRKIHKWISDRLSSRDGRVLRGDVESGSGCACFGRQPFEKPERVPSR